MAYFVFINKNCSAEKLSILDKWNEILKLEKDLTNMVNKYTNDKEECIIGLHHSYAWVRCADAADESIGLDFFLDRVSRAPNTAYIFPYAGGYVVFNVDVKIENYLDQLANEMKMSCLNAMLFHYQKNDFHYASVSRKAE